MRTILLTLFAFIAFNLHAQLEPVKWSFDVQKVNEQEYDIILTADIDRGWSVYSQFSEADSGPLPTTIEIQEEDVKIVGTAKESGRKKESFDENFGVSLVKFSGKARFTQRVKVANDTTSVKGSVRYMTCDAESCLPPTDVDFELALNND